MQGFQLKNVASNNGNRQLRRSQVSDFGGGSGGIVHVSMWYDRRFPGPIELSSVAAKPHPILQVT